MGDFPDYHVLAQLIQAAKAEDLGLGYGGAGDDVTSRLTIPQGRMGVGVLRLKEPGVVAGLPMVEMVCRAYDERLKVEMVAGLSMEQAEGRYFEGPTPLMRMAGPMRSLLSAERVVLNFVQRMSGVATLTRKFVQAGQGAKVYDTRKTVPGHRVLDKYAVVCGGGFNHRIGLYDAVFVKDNHLAGVGLGEMAGFLADVVGRARSEIAGAESAVRQVVVEVDTLEQLAEVLKVKGVDVVLLDNMDCDTMRRAVGMRNASGSKAELEASGGVTLETIRAIAATGVERISVGAMTHSARVLDVSLDVG